MQLRDTFTIRFGDEHTAALQRLARLYRRSRADTVRLLVEREAERLDVLRVTAAQSIIVDRPEVIA